MQITEAHPATRVSGPARAGAFDHLVFAGERAARVPRAIPPRAERRPLLRQPTAPGPRARELLAWACAQRGLDLAAYRPSFLGRRELACLRAIRARTAEEARARLERDPRLVDRAVSALLIGVTGFRRDPEVFTALARRLPELERRHGGVRVISIGCSDGSELYSVAMLLDEQGLLAESELQGFDCRAEAIAHARSGVFGERALAGLDAGRRERAFRRDGDVWRLRPEIARASRFEVADALALPRGLSAELVLCRNLAIYLEPAAAARLWTQVAALLPPGGLLVTGKAERPAGARPFTRIGPCLYRAAEAEA